MTCRNGSIAARTHSAKRGGIAFRSALGGLLALGVTATAAAEPELDARIAAAQQTADSYPACADISRFYWEIGDENGVLTSGASGGWLAPRASTQMPIYSAGKWIDAAYTVEKLGGHLNQDDVQALTMTAGFVDDGACVLARTVGACQRQLANFDADAQAYFRYGPGHYQDHAANKLALASLTRAQLATEIRDVLGALFGLSYDTPQLAGGARSNAADYGEFLRRLLRGAHAQADGLLLGARLGENKVCTNTEPSTAERPNCPTALYSPVSDARVGLMEAWDYSLGHWVEDDPVHGDGAFSSIGSAGFYPWIDNSRTYYGILARNVLTNPSAGDSIKCGRMIRKAWMEGVAVTQ